MEPSLIFLGIGGLFGMKVGLSMLLGLVINYGILAPRLIEQKVIGHPPPTIKAVALPQLPLALKAGQTFAVQLEEAVGRPQFPSPEELKADPKLSYEVSTRVLRYTWTRPTVYHKFSGLIERPQRGHPPERFAQSVARRHRGNRSPRCGCPGQRAQPRAPTAVTWEAKLSLPADQPAGILTALGLQLGPNAKPADVQRVADQAEDSENKAMPSIGGYSNICKWSLWPGATVLVVGGLLALAFQWRTLGRTFASIFAIFGNKRNAAKGPLDHLEIPMTWFVVGFLGIGILAAMLLNWFFDVRWWMGAVAVVLTFFLASVAARAGAETSINPIGALGKVTQLTFGCWPRTTSPRT